MVATEGGIFDAAVYQSPNTGPKQTQTGSKTAPNGCPKNTLGRVAPSAKHLLGASRQISCKKWRIFAFFGILSKNVENWFNLYNLVC